MHAQPSQFVAWQYLKHNELARDHGNRLFYTDHTGETVPASDDEGDDVSACVCVSAHALATM